MNKKEEDPISSSKKEPKKEAEKEKPAASSDYDEKDPEAGAPKKTVTIEPNLVVRKKREPTAPISKDESGKGSDKERTVTHPDCNRRNLNARGTEADETVASRSKQETREKEEPSISLISLSHNSNPHIKDRSSVPLLGERRSTSIARLRDGMRTGYKTSGSERSMDSHPVGRYSSKKITTDTHRIKKVGNHEHVV